jgi:hypothetical protein
MAFGDQPTLEKPDDVLRELEQADAVRHGRLRAPHALGHVAEREAELIHEHCVGPRLLDRRKVFPRHVLDEREQERFAVIGLANEGRNRREARGTRGTPAPFAGDQLPGAAGDGANNDGLHETLRPHRIGKLRDSLGIEAPPRLTRVRANRPERQLDELGGSGRTPDQHLEAPPQAASGRLSGHVAAFMAREKRAEQGRREPAY